MKKLFFLSILLCLTLYMQAAQITVTTTAGNLRKDLGAIVGFDAQFPAGSRLNPVSDLKINGTLNAQDFADVMYPISQSLQTLDLSGVTAIEALNDSPAGQLPASACYQWKAMTTITLPANAVITSIGKQAFSDCTALTSINGLDGITTINDYAFSNTGFTAITLPNSVTTLGSGVFGQSKSLANVTLSNNLAAIPQATFASTKLSSINIPASVTTIGNQAFQGCSSLTTITIPATVQWLGGDRTFDDCESLTTINFPAGIQIIDGKLNQTFDYTQITSFTIPSNVTTLGQSTFAAVPLTSLTFPTNNLVTTIGDYCLSGASLTSLVIPEGVTSLGAGVLYGNATLQTIELPASLTTIGSDAFNSCSGLQSIKVKNTFPITLPTGVFTGVDQTKCILYVPSSALAAYKAADGWKNFSNIAENAKTAQTITGLSDFTANVGDADITLAATASSGLAVTYAVADATIATVSTAGLVHILKEGTTTITATQAGNDTYSAVSTTANLTVYNYSWLLAPAITVEGTNAKVVGTDAAKFTKFYINGTAATMTNGKVDLSNQTGTLILKATTDDSTGEIKLTINKSTTTAKASSIVIKSRINR